MKTKITHTLNSERAQTILKSPETLPAILTTCLSASVGAGLLLLCRGVDGREDGVDEDIFEGFAVHLVIFP